MAVFQYVSDLALCIYTCFSVFFSLGLMYLCNSFFDDTVMYHMPHPGEVTYESSYSDHDPGKFPAVGVVRNYVINKKLGLFLVDRNVYHYIQYRFFGSEFFSRCFMPR
jgi:hypothetical protein